MNKKNKKIFLLLFSVFLILTIFYFSFNKISSLENLRNQITPLTSDSETISYCGSSDPYDSDGIQIKNKKIAGCTKNHWMTPTFLNNSCQIIKYISAITCMSWMAVKALFGRERAMKLLQQLLTSDFTLF